MNHRGCTLFVAVAILFLAICSCFRRSIEVIPNDLPALSRFDKDHPVSVFDQGEQVLVEPRFDPELYFNLRTGRTIAADLEHLEVKDGGIRLAKAHRPFVLKSYRDLTLSSDEIRSISMSLSGHVPPDWDPKWGLVFWLLGPGGYLGMGAQWYATDWISLDVGTSWVTDQAWSDGIGAFVGFRILPVRWRLKPYLGASTTGVVFFKSSAGKTAIIAGRTGFDLEVYNNRMLLRWELNFVYFLDKSGWPFEKLESDRGGIEMSGFLPWTGFAVILMY